MPIGTLTARILNCKQFENLRQERFSFAVDYDTINSNLVCRNKHEGDRFYDSRRGVSKSMKKYLISNKTSTAAASTPQCIQEDM